MMTISRNRFVYFALTLAVVALGLASRHFRSLPPFVHNYVGDALWALMVFLGFGFLFPNLSTLRLAALSIAFAFCIEFSQLYQAPWINAIRETRLGGLVLGFGFIWTDLVSYFVGIGFGVLAETAFRHLGHDDRDMK